MLPRFSSGILVRGSPAAGTLGPPLRPPFWRRLFGGLLPWAGDRPLAINRPAFQSQDYRRALAHETLLSERKRTLALLGVLILLTAGTTATFIGIPGFGAMMPGMKVWYPLRNYGPFILFELVMVFTINRRLARNQDISLAIQYITAFVEISIPSVTLILHVNRMGTANAFGFFAPFLYSFFIILSTLRLRFWLAAFTGAVAAAQMFAIAYIYLPSQMGAGGGMPMGSAMPMAGGMAVMMQNVQLTLGYHLSRSAALLGAGVIAGWVATQLRRQFAMTMQAVAARESVTNLFGQHVSPQVVDRLLATGGDKVSEMRRVAVMFVDIRGFTTAAQTRPPAEVVSRLDDAFTVMVEVIDTHGGVVNKFLGDGFLAMFGAPLADERATHNAVAAGRELLAVVERRNVEHPDWPIRIGIGIHVGEAVTGIVGSPRRKEYTVIGDTVNLASRIEALNKEFGSQFLVSDAVRSEIGEQASDARARENLEVRGYDKPICVWQLA